MNSVSAELFKKNFECNDPIILYGTGNGARCIVENCDDHIIIGILDREKKDGDFFGKPIITFEKLKNMPVKKIVIAAMPVNVRTIFRRIKKQCEELNIHVYNLEGEDLANVFSDEKIDIPFFQKNWTELKEFADGCEVISFDVFDTLLIRSVMKPEDLFEIMEHRLDSGLFKNKSFKACREEALKIAANKYGEPTIDEIYIELQKIVGEKITIIADIKELEFSLEKEIISPRQSVVDFMKLVACKKKVFLVSNMYWPKDYLEILLKENGINGYDELIVSCDYRKNKSDGLYDVLINKADVNPDRILHIGDNEYVDGICAERAGLKTYTIMDKTLMLNNSFLSDLSEYNVDLLHNLLISSVTNTLFDDPFSLCELKGRVYIESLEKYVKAIIVPCGIIYSLWIMEMALKKNVDYLLFTSRDGYIVKQIIDILAKNQVFPPGAYFYTSRRVVSAAASNGKEDYFEVASREFYGKLGELFSIRFNVTIGSKEYELPITDSNIKLIIDSYVDELNDSCGRIRDNYIKYINEVGIPHSMKVAGVDQVGIGNVQYGIEKLIPDNDYIGFFLKRINDPQKKISYESFYPQMDAYSLRQHLSLASLMFEHYFSSHEATVKSFNEDGKPIFEVESRSVEQLDTLEYMHLETIKLTQKMKDILQFIEEVNVTWKFMDCFLSLLDETVACINVRELQNMTLEDEFGSAGQVKVK